MSNSECNSLTISTITRETCSILSLYRRNLSIGHQQPQTLVDHCLNRTARHHPSTLSTSSSRRAIVLRSSRSPANLKASRRACPKCHKRPRPTVTRRKRMKSSTRWSQRRSGRRCEPSSGNWTRSGRNARLSLISLNASSRRSSSPKDMNDSTDLSYRLESNNMDHKLASSLLIPVMWTWL